MKQYIGTKTIGAEPMTFLKWEAFNGRYPEVDDRPGYMVQYPDGYKSWSPKEAFEDAYRELLFPVADSPDVVSERRIYPPVFSSRELTVAVKDDKDYGGAHYYQFKNSVGFSNGKAEYVDSFQHIQFVQKNEDGTIVPGIQSEQLIIAILDRTEKLNAKYPSDQNTEMMDGLLIFLEACKKRIEDRMNRGVMGDLKK